MGIFDGTFDIMDTSDLPVLIGATGVVIFVTMALFRRSRSRLPPGPRRWPVVGNIPQLSGDRMFYVKLNDLRKQHGDIVFLTLGSLKILVVFGHDLVKEVLGHRDEDFKYRPQWLIEIQKLELFNGMVWSNGDTNNAIREFALPALFPGVGAKTLEERVQEEADVVIAEIGLETNGEPTNLIKTFHQAVSNINYGTVFESRADYNDPEYLRLTDMMDQLLQRQGIKNPLNFFPALRVLPQGKKARHSQDVMNDIKVFIKDKIAKAKETYDQENIRSLLDLYIKRCNSTESNSAITEESVCHITRDLFVAGTENVAIALQWLIGYMVKYPNIQEKCREEIKQIIWKTEEVGLNDIQKMPYVEATVNEVLRLANIAPLSVPHATINEVEFHGYTIPKDTMVLTHLESVHMDPKYWESPEEFLPDRFLQDGKPISREAYYPFSLGSRYCPAHKLALMELSIIFCKLLQTYTFKLPEGSSQLCLKGIQPGAFVEPSPFQVCCVPCE